MQQIEYIDARITVVSEKTEDSLIILCYNTETGERCYKLVVGDNHATE